MSKETCNQCKTKCETCEVVALLKSIIEAEKEMFMRMLKKQKPITIDEIRQHLYPN